MSRADAQPRPLVAGKLRSTDSRRRMNSIFVGICVATAFASVVILVVLLLAIVVQGRHYLGWRFLVNPPSRIPHEAGIGPALWGTIWVCTGCALFTLPLGVATAIFLEEFKPRLLPLRWLHSFIQLNIANLSGVPSVVYGIIGLTAFAYMFGLFSKPGDKQAPWEIGVSYRYQFLAEDGVHIAIAPARGHTEELLEIPRDLQVRQDGKLVPAHIIGATDPLPADPKLLARTFRDDALGGRLERKRWYYLRLPFGRGVLTGSLTLMLVVLPIVIIASQESLRAVPDSLREGALGMGATRWQMVWNVTLPASVPGIMTGAILAMSRAIGEAAPILMISGVVYLTNAPGHLMDDFAVMPLQIYDWAGRPQIGFHHLAASGIIVLLAVLLAFNAVAVFIRQKYQKPLS
jgi:phosphate transport system permease protein